MFDLILNVKSREVISQISLDQLIDTLKNPSQAQRSIVDAARKLDKKSAKYKKIKESLPCIVPNYNHSNYVKATTTKKDTGFLYIDVDETKDIDVDTFPFIAAKWKSLSGGGAGYLIAVEGLPKQNPTKKELELAIVEVSKVLGIPPDLEAITRDRLNVIGYDEEVYYNPNYSKFVLTKEVVKDTIKKNIKKSVHTVTNGVYNTRLATDGQFSNSKDTRYSNLDEMLLQYTFSPDEVFKDLGENKLKYAELYIPSSISEGERNSKLFGITTKKYGLNPHLTRERLYGFIFSVNSSVCTTPLSSEEVSNIVNKVIERGATLYANKEKRFIFNPDYMLTGKERKSIAATESNLKRGINTTNEIGDLIENWDVLQNGKITYKKIAEILGKGYTTVRRRKSEFDFRVKMINKSIKKVA